MNMDFGTNKTSAEIIKDKTFGGTSFSDIYSGNNSKCYRKSWKKFNELKNIDKKYYYSNYYDIIVNENKVKSGTSLRFWDNFGKRLD